MDLDLRERERACLADPSDQQALAAYLDALARAGLPITGDLLERRVLPARAFESRLPLAAGATLPDGDEVHLGWTPGRVEVPPHRAWWVAARPRSEDALRALAGELRAQQVDGLRLDATEVPAGALRELPDHLATLELRRGLRGVGADDLRACEGLAALTSLRVDNSTTEVEDGTVDLLARHARLTSLELVRPAPLTHACAAALARLPALTALRLSFRELFATHVTLQALGGLPAVRAMRLAGSFALDLVGVEALARAPRLSRLGVGAKEVDDDALERLVELPLRLDLRRLDRATTARVALAARAEGLVGLSLDLRPDVRLDALAGHPALERLDISAGVLADHHLTRIATLPRLARLSWTATGFPSQAPIERLGALARLRALHAHNIDEEAVARLPALPALRSLGLRVTGRITSPRLARVARCAALEELSLDLDGADGGIDEAALSQLAGLPRLRALNLNHKLTLDAPGALAALPALEELKLPVPLRDPDRLQAIARLEGLAAAPRLRCLMVHGIDDHDRERLAAALPEVDVRVGPW